MARVLKFGKRTINIETLDKELRATLRDSIAGVTRDWDGEIGVVVPDEVEDEGLEAAIAAVLEAHNPDTKTQAQLRLERKLEALVDIELADLRALKQELDAATTVADFKRLLQKLFLLVYRLIQLNEATDDVISQGARE